MPELPDVEIYKRYVDATSLHRDISDVFLREQLVDEPSPQTLRAKLAGSPLRETRRHGKHLFIELDDGWLRLHFGMTGYLHASREDGPGDHTELLVEFEDGSNLAYVNERKFGSVGWVEDVDVFISDSDLGPDPLADGLDQAGFEQCLQGRSGSIKSTLMSQDVLAGLGNVYSDEILFQAGIHPESSTEAVAGNDLDELFTTMIRVIEGAIDRKADPEKLPESWLLPRREPGADCPRDDGELDRVEVGGRATYVCRTHQSLRR